MSRTLICLIFILLSLLSCQEAEQMSSEAKNKTAQSFDENAFAKGESLFNEQCLKCHAIGKKDGFNINFWKQVPGKNDSAKLEWFKVYLANSDSLAKAGDSYAVALKDEYNNINSHQHKLSKKEVEQIVYYMVNYRESN